MPGAAQARPAPAARPPVFMNLEPFTVNLLEEGGEHYLQTSIVFQVADEKAMETMKAYLPVIRSRILMLLSSKRPSDLSSPAGKAKLVEELTQAVRESIPGTTPDRGIVQASSARSSSSRAPRPTAAMANEFLSQEEVDTLLKGVVDEPEVRAGGPAAAFAPTSSARRTASCAARMPTLEIINDRFARLLRIGLFNFMRRTPQKSRSRRCA